MKSKNRKLLPALLCILLVLLSFAGCAQMEDAEPTIPKWKSLREKAEYLAFIAEESDFSLLEECINLEYLDLTGSTCYDAILNYINNHPQVEVIYTAPLGNLTLSNTETEVALEPGTYDLAALQQQLKYLPNLTSLTLPKTALTPNDLASLQEAFSNLEIIYSVDILGQEYLTDTAELDLSGLTGDALEETVGKLALLPQLAEVTLPESLAMEEVKFLMDALPDVTFHYTFELFGKTVSTTDEIVEYEKVEIGDAGEAQLRAALDILPLCKSFRVEDCGFSNEVLGGIQADYPDTKIIWRVRFGEYYSCRTDETMLRTVYNVYNSHAESLKYLTSLKYIDMGHNSELTDISFLAHMPDLEILILSGAPITNLDPLENCDKLVWLELANCYYLNDISALEGNESIKFLNISYAKVDDLSPIENLPLERFVFLNPPIADEELETFQQRHPDCAMRFTGTDPLIYLWRYSDWGLTPYDYYLFVREVFDLDEVDRRLKQQADAEADRWEKEHANDNNSGDTPQETTPPATEAPDPAPTPDPAPDPAPTPAPAPSPDPTPDPAPET